MDTVTMQGAEARRALRAVYGAIAALRHSPGSPAVAQAISRAGTAVEALPSGLTSEALYRLLGTVEDCHRAGVSSSARLGERWRAVSTAVRLSA
jgi:hypothetical protein